MQCPRCQSTQVIKNGRIHTGKPKWMCKRCKRQFVANPSNRRISADTKALIDKLLLERLSLAKKEANHIGAIWHFIHHYNTLLNA